jgi:DNA-directed RNA polymerase subunit RPC12/RpoP
MLKETKVYSYICDKCKKESSDEEDNVGWNDKEYAWECAEEMGWAEIDHSHYCSNCWEHDDDDNQVVRRDAE